MKLEHADSDMPSTNDGVSTVCTAEAFCCRVFRVYYYRSILSIILGRGFVGEPDFQKLLNEYHSATQLYMDFELLSLALRFASRNFRLERGHFLTMIIHEVIAYKKKLD